MKESELSLLAEKIPAFDPLIYKKGRKTYLVGKINNRFYRIFFSFAKPSLLFVSKDKVEAMTAFDVQKILTSFDAYENAELTEKISQLAILYKTFKENYIKNTDINPALLYEKILQTALTHPDFQLHAQKAVAQIEREKAERLTTVSVDEKEPANQIESQNTPINTGKNAIEGQNAPLNEDKNASKSAKGESDTHQTESPVANVQTKNLPLNESNNAIEGKNDPLNTAPKAIQPQNKEQNNPVLFNLLPTEIQITYGKKEQTDIAPVILTEQMIFARQKGVTYRLFLKNPPVFEVSDPSLGKSDISALFLDILQQVEESYQPAFLKAFNLSDYRLYFNQLQHGLEKESTSAQTEGLSRDEKALDVQTASLFDILQERLSQKSDPKSALEAFLADGYSGSFRQYYKILQLENALQKGKSDLTQPTNQITDTPLFLDGNNRVYAKRGDLLYVFALPPQNAFFKCYYLEIKDGDFKIKGGVIPRFKKVVEVLKEGLSLDSTDENRLTEALAPIYNAYVATPHKETKKTTHPSMTQLYQTASLKNKLTGEGSDISPVFAGNDVIFAFLNGLYIRATNLQAEPEISAFCLAENKEVLLTSADLSLFKQALKTSKIRMTPQCINLMKHIKQKIESLNTEEIYKPIKAKKEKNKTTLGPIMPSISDKESSMTENNKKQPKEKPVISIKTLKAKEKPNLTPQKTATPVIKTTKKAEPEQITSQVAMSEPALLATIYALFEDKTPIQTGLLKGITRRAAFKIKRPINFSEMDFDAFYRKHTQKEVNFRYLWQTLHLKNELDKIGTKAKVLYGFPPILCSDNVLYHKQNNMLSAISLDENNPFFKIIDLEQPKNSAQKLPWDKALKIIHSWCTSPSDETTLIARLQPLYQTAPLTNKAPKPLPFFDEVYNYYFIKALLEQKIKKARSFDVTIPPTVCEGNQIVAKKGPYYYKMEAGSIIRFEKMYGQNISLMTHTETRSFLAGCKEQGIITKVQQQFLMRLYEETHLPLFNGHNGQSISPKLRDQVYKGCNYSILQCLKNEQSRQK